ncbi:MAG TPA: hypothetical protein VHX44_08110 [Planctomycetota bacterium]|nr:hypothetical protein [Planctomycetota bacterium]
MKLLAPILLALALAAPLSAEVKLTTLPDRERVVVRFEDNGRVLVEEARTLTLDKGTTTVNFTWLGVNIDRGSIQLLGVNGVPFTVLRTTYPPDQGNSLSWEVSSANPGPAQVRISYLLDGLSREVALRAVIAEGKSELSLRVYQRLINQSGENYDQASLQAAFGDLRDSPLASGETRQQLAAKFLDVPFTKRYTYDPTLGERVGVAYVLKNSVEGKLGSGILPAGKVRMFLQTGTSEAFLGEDWAQPTPLGEDLELKIGDTKDLTVRRAMLKTRQDIIQRDHQNRAALWHQLQEMRFEVENFTTETKTIDLVEHLQGEWDVLDPQQVLEKRIAPEQYEAVPGEANPAGELVRKDADTLLIKLPVPPNRRIVFTATLRRLNLH